MTHARPREKQLRAVPAARLAFLLLAAVALVPSAARAADHLLITEFAVRPTDGEFIEIFNPTENIVDLSQYFLSDYVLASDPLNISLQLVAP